MQSGWVVSLKRLIKEMMLRVGGEPLVRWYWRRRGVGHDSGHLATPSRRERFARIYRDGVWVKYAPGSPASGPGSSLEATSELRAHLPKFLDNLNISSILDVGCGDMTWMSQTQLKQKYIGIDIVPEVIAANIATLQDQSHTFRTLDICTEIPPTADAALCREIFFHLSYSDTKKALANIKKSGVRYLIATSDPTLVRNYDISTADFREINLEIFPYNLGTPEATLSDAAGPNPSRLLGAWRVSKD
jgi:SAM-dependent methyltransferase